MKKFFLLPIILIVIFLANTREIFVLAENEIVTSIPAEKNLTLEINFTHSVQKTPVIEELEFDGEKFILRRTKYKSHGVGLPFMESDGEFREEDGYFIIDNMNRPLENLSLRTGVGTNLTIKLGGEEFKLYEKFPAGTKIDIKISSPLKIFFEKIIGRNF